MRIVIVDDQPSCHLLAEHILLELCPECQIVKFTDSRQALDYVSTTPINLLLLDYYMPGMDGMGFLVEMKKTINEKVPCVLISVADDRNVHKTALQLGAFDVLLKPVRPRELKSHCKKWLAWVDDIHRST